TRFRLGALLSFACALGAKETAMVFPFLLIATYVLFPSTLSTASSATAGAVAGARAVTPFLILLGADVLYRMVVLQHAALGAGLGTIPLGVRLLTTPRLVLSYITLPLRAGALTVCDDYGLSIGWNL